jgi:ABC-type tungstate transport system permease subunit
LPSDHITAALVYGRRKHIINVFVLVSQRSIPAEDSGQHNGYNWFERQKDGRAYLAISDTSSTDLLQLRHLFLKE